MVTLVQMRKEAKGESHSQSPDSGVQAWLQGARLEPLQHRAPWVGARSRDSTGLHSIQLFRGLPFLDFLICKMGIDRVLVTGVV